MNHIGPAFQLLFTRIHINLSHPARTHPYTYYLHVHPADGNTWNKYSNHQPRPGWEGGVKKKKTRDLSPALSLVTVIPQQILTRPGHIFNLWPNSTATERPARRSHSVCSVGGVVVAEARDTSPRGGVWVFMSDSVQCKQLGCCLPLQPSNTLVLRFTVPFTAVMKVLLGGEVMEAYLVLELFYCAASTATRVHCVTSVCTAEQTVRVLAWVCQRSENLQTDAISDSHILMPLEQGTFIYPGYTTDSQNAKIPLNSTELNRKTTTLVYMLSLVPCFLQTLWNLSAY